MATPLPVLTPEELRAVEARVVPGAQPPLMERAGHAVAEAARAMARDDGAAILVVAGPGNNGGDAWVAAARLRQSFHRVVVLDATGKPPSAEEARAAQQRFVDAGGESVRAWPAATRFALVVDGLLGLGLARDVDGAFSALIGQMNASPAPILAIDVPSGLDSGSGQIRGTAVRATRTLTFIARKTGLFTADGPDHCGAIECDELGVGEEARRAAHGFLLTPEVARSWLAPRRRNSHKGDFGTLGVVGGNRGMVGAALLAAQAGLLAGAGRVLVGLLGTDAPTVDPAHPELMLRAVDDVIRADVLVAGPGAGRSVSATSASVFERTVMPTLLAQPRALVLDADALNATAAHEALATQLAARRDAPTILTPHPAEAARLLHTETRLVQADRLAAALRIARRFHAHVVLKGAGSICAGPDGRWWVNTTGNPGLATAGSGDVLAGIIGALLCQRLNAEHALAAAVCLHGAAADACALAGIGPVGLTASEVALAARRVLNEWCA